MKPAAKRRLICAGLFAALLFTEIMIGMYAHGFVRVYIGDVLVMPAMYFFVRIFTRAVPAHPAAHTVRVRLRCGGVAVF